MPVKYTGTVESGTDGVSLSLIVSSNKTLCLELLSVHDESNIFLDEDTAVQFAKDLRRSIAKIKEVKRG